MTDYSSSLDGMNPAELRALAAAALSKANWLDSISAAEDAREDSQDDK